MCNNQPIYFILGQNYCYHPNFMGHMVYQSNMINRDRHGVIIMNNNVHSVGISVLDIVIQLFFHNC